MKQRSHSKVTRKAILKGLAEGKRKSEIAKEAGCTPSAVTKQFKMLVNDDYVRSYDKDLANILKSASMTFINDSLNHTKRQKASLLQCVTAAGILIDKQRNTPATRIDINLIQNNIQKVENHLEVIQNRIEKASTMDDDMVIEIDPKSLKTADSDGIFDGMS